ncbi:hypothetical protein D7D52_36770 [Nocardia yunnanensis]|uniref:Uncharacterized protein n=1 Tax=Nocardia yunnanensis TaxID=2382165 RepID=A0A386ZPH2_9NOCA|nr:hypothetical protein D7D52_36770 [Nocardia yunnanensis]
MPATASSGCRTGHQQHGRSGSPENAEVDFGSVLVREDDCHLDQVGGSSYDIDCEPDTFKCGDHVIGHLAWWTADVGEQVDIL